MYSKLKTEKLIDEEVPKLLKLFKLEDWSITFHVYKEGDSSLKKLAPLCYKGYSGATFLGANNTADIIIFYGHKDKKETYSTIIHELLHCVVSKLSSHITIMSDVAEDVEEELVGQLEKLLVERL